MDDFSSVEDLRVHYQQFKGQPLSEVFNYVQKNYPSINLKTNKGIVGQLLEATIGNPPNSDPNPDVAELGVELKVLPLRVSNRVLQPKERSKIKSINYNAILNEEWENAAVRGKMEKMLFLLYEHPTGKTYKEWEEFIFKGTLYYELQEQKENIVKEDWVGIKYKVENGQADDLSGSQSKILEASTSGSGKKQKYLDGSKEAKPRSYSLKNSYLKVFYKENFAKKKYQDLDISPSKTAEEYILEKLKKKLDNKTLNSIVKKYDINFSNNTKSAFSLLIKRIFQVDGKKHIRQLEENGINIKTIPVRSTIEKASGRIYYKPWEAMSFPKFSLKDLIYEEWNGTEIDDDEVINEATFKFQIDQKFIFVPLIKEKDVDKNGKKKRVFEHWTKWKIGQLVFWEPTEKELEKIKKEWEKAKKIVTTGVKTRNVRHGSDYRQKNNLLKAKETCIIHIRPHARNSRDLDLPYQEYTEDVIKICWQSFWLNKDYTQKIINQELAVDDK